MDGKEAPVIGTDNAAEEALLAACLQSVTARKEARRIIDGRDFFSPHREAIWDAMSKLDRDGEPVDLYTVNAAVGDAGGALDVLIRLTGHSALPDHAGHYAATVREWAVRRRLYGEALEVQRLAENADLDALGLTAQVATRFAQLRDSGSVEDAQSI